MQCLQQEPCSIAPASAPAPVQAPKPEQAPLRLVAQQPFVAKHKYKPAPVEAPVLAVSAPLPLSNSVCTCGSDTQGVRAGPVITFEYAGEPEYQPGYSLMRAGASCL